MDGSENMVNHTLHPRVLRFLLVALTLAVTGTAIALLIPLRSAPADLANQRADAKYSYRVLQQPATIADRVTDRRITPDIMANDMPELDPDGTRVVRRVVSETLAVIPTRAGAACLALMARSGHAGRMCTTADDPSTALIRYEQAVGLVPDGVSDVTYRLSDGRKVQGAVVDNLYEAPANAASVTLVIDGATKTVDLMPTGSLPEGARVSEDGTVEIGNVSP